MYSIILKSYEKNKSQKWRSKRSKESASFLGHHLHLPQESAGCDSLRPPQFSCLRWPLMSLRRHPKSVNLDAHETVLMLKISARCEKQSGRRKKSVEGFYEAKLCAKWNRRKVTLRRSVRSTMQTATKDQNVDLAHWVVPDKAFSSYAKKLTFLRAEWERLPNNRKLNSDIEKYVKFVMYHAVIYKKTLQT